jgi:Ca2+-binding RTX toxin-like protein
MPQYPATVSLAALTAQTGFSINHADPDDVFGASLASGDFDGDGLDDLLIGAPGSNAPGAAYLVFGSTALGTAVTTSGLTGTNGFRIDGAGTQTAGNSVSIADVDRDGFDDLIIGSQQSDAGASQGGSAYVVYGTGAAQAATFALSGVDGSNGFRFDGTDVLDRAGFTVSAGDVNGDRIDDVIASSEGGFGGGKTYVVFGQGGPAPRPPLGASALDGDNGFVIDPTGAYSLSFSYAVAAGAGDFNRDGFDDIIVNPIFGTEVFLVYGKADFDASFALSTVDGVSGANGLRLTNVGNSNYTSSVSAAGDLNGDGLDDLLVASDNSNIIDGDFAGAAYVVFGRSDAVAEIDVTTLNGADGFAMKGAFGGQQLGAFVSSAGDMNGDGFDDILVAGDEAETPAYVVFGKATGWTAEFEPATLNGDNGFALTGGAGYSFGPAAAAGDVNGDGLDDLAITDLGANAGAGAVHIVYGRLSEVAVNRIGSAANQEIHGSDLDDTLSALGGSDTLRGHDGDDILKGGEVYDTLDGGDGHDTVDYTASAKRIVAKLAGPAPQSKGEGRDTLVSVENLIGSAFNDRLTGDAEDNHLWGGVGRDRIGGGDGADTLAGGAGADLLAGSDGADVFVFAEIDSPIERIIDLEAGDTIDLSAIDAIAGGDDDAFTLVETLSGQVGEMAFDVHRNNDYTDLLLDIDGDGAGDVVIRMTGDQSDFTGFVF